MRFDIKVIKIWGNLGNNGTISIKESSTHEILQ